jgi:Ras-related protein Rab-18
MFLILRCRFRTLTASYYRGAHGIILVYDQSSAQTFENLKFWLDEVKKYATNREAVKMLVANKVDKVLVSLIAYSSIPQLPAQVSRAQGEAFAIENSMLFIETSACTSLGVKQAFEELVFKVLDSPSLLTNTLPPGARGAVKLSSDTGQTNGGCC